VSDRRRLGPEPARHAGRLRAGPRAGAVPGPAFGRTAGFGRPGGPFPPGGPSPNRRARWALLARRDPYTTTPARGPTGGRRTSRGRPSVEFPWRKVRRRSSSGSPSASRSLIFVLLIAGPIVVIGQMLSARPACPGSGLPVAAVVIVGLIVLLAISGTARSARRFAVPFGDLIEATGKVEAGDYTARVPCPATACASCAG
jgi:hypothetical protein